MSFLLEHALENIIHDILLDVHEAEKSARIQSALVELDQKVEAVRKNRGSDDDTSIDNLVVETDAAILQDGNVQLKGNPFKTVRSIICPRCHLPRLLYPRVGFNSRPPPDSNQQYCKNEPAIIIDKHDVHGQRKKGVKVKGQAKSKSKKKSEAASPASSEKSDPLTPSTSFGGVESFEFKEIEVPAAKCPNKNSRLDDHWKSVTVFATHLTGSCYLKRDRAAGREANAKIVGTPRDSRASSPKAVNGTKRSRPADDNEGNGKKKQKLDTPKKNSKALGPTGRLRDPKNQEIEDSASIGTEGSDVIQVDSQKLLPKASEVEKDAIKSKPNGVISGKKPGKLGKKASGNK